MNAGDAAATLGDARLTMLLRAFHLASPALPVGAFAYSQGLERAIEDRIVVDETSALRWVGDLLELVLARFEAPLWVRAHAAYAAADTSAFALCNQRLLASRETAELRAESLLAGGALLRLFAALGLPAPPPVPLAYPAAFAAACAGLGLDAEAGLGAFLWGWTENQVLAAVRTLPLGQLAGQRMLTALLQPLACSVASALALPDGKIGSAPVRFAITSARHEIQYSRLFRS